MSLKNNYKCLLIKMQDDRKFFTHEENYPDLLEFSKTFGAEISVVQVKKAEVLDLKELPMAVCNSNYKPKADYEVLELKLNCPKKIKQMHQCGKREKILETASEIKKFIINEFVAGRTVSLHVVDERFKEKKLSLSAICNHISRARKELKSQGYKVSKIRAGEYRISS